MRGSSQTGSQRHVRRANLAQRAACTPVQPAAPEVGSLNNQNYSVGEGVFPAYLSFSFFFSFPFAFSPFHTFSPSLSLQATAEGAPFDSCASCKAQKQNCFLRSTHQKSAEGCVSEVNSVKQCSEVRIGFTFEGAIQCARRCQWVSLRDRPSLRPRWLPRIRKPLLFPRVLHLFCSSYA